MNEFREMSKANREVVLEGLDRLRKVFETFIHERQEQGKEFALIDGLMIGHNFYKLVIWHLAEEMGLPKKGRDALLKVAIDTLTQVLKKPLTNETDTEMS